MPRRMATRLVITPILSAVLPVYRTGIISLDVQFLPDVDIPCPDYGGSQPVQPGGGTPEDVRCIAESVTGRFI